VRTRAASSRRAQLSRYTCNVRNQRHAVNEILPDNLIFRLEYKYSKLYSDRAESIYQPAGPGITSQSPIFGVWNGQRRTPIARRRRWTRVARIAGQRVRRSVFRRDDR
jgi:hypothetical protein